MLKGFRAASALVATLAVCAACAVHNPDEPPVAGPSVLALSLVATATPDSIYQDGGSQSSIVVTARDPNGKAISGVSLHLDIAQGGTIQDFGSLSAKNVVTGSDGRASAVYTAPPPFSPLAGVAGVRVSILVTPIGNNYQTSQFQSADIRLFPVGVVLPPSGKPTATFTVTPTPVTQNVPTTFDATASQPGSGATQIVTYGWDFGDGTTGSGSKTQHTFNRTGSFTVTLAVTDDRNGQNTTTQVVQVAAGTPPTASFVFSPTNPVVGQAVVFNADGSKAAPGHTLVQYSWIWGDGTPGDTNFVATHTFTTAGTYNVTLTVRDDTDAKNTVSQTVTVGLGNPTAVLTLTKAGGNSINADGSASTAASGSSIATYSFTWGDSSGATVGSAPTASHTYAVAGTYTVVLRVTDNATPARSMSATATITVP